MWQMFTSGTCVKAYLHFIIELNVIVKFSPLSACVIHRDEKGKDLLQSLYFQHFQHVNPLQHNNILDIPKVNAFQRLETLWGKEKILVTFPTKFSEVYNLMIVYHPFTKTYST